MQTDLKMVEEKRAPEPINSLAPGRSPSPDYDDDYQDIPEVPEEYEDIPVYKGTPEANDTATSWGEAADTKLNVTKTNVDTAWPECTQGYVSVKALTVKLNQQIAVDSPSRNVVANKLIAPSAAAATPTREIRTHSQLARRSLPAATAQESKHQEEEILADSNIRENFPSPPIREHFKRLDVHASVAATDRESAGGLESIRKKFEVLDARKPSPEVSSEGIGGLQMSDEEFKDSDIEACESQTPASQRDKHFLATRNSQEVNKLQASGDSIESLEKDGKVTRKPHNSIGYPVKVFSEDKQDGKELTANDHARATLTAMKAKCTVNITLPLPPKVQADEEHEDDPRFSAEDIRAITDVLLHPARNLTSDDMSRVSEVDLSKINAHIREAVKEIHHSPSVRASSMLKKFREKEAGCTKVPTPTIPRGSILGLQPGRSLMPVSGLRAANNAALVTIAAISPLKNSTVQHSGRSKMPKSDGGLQAANRAAFEKVNSSKIQQPNASQGNIDLQKKDSSVSDHVNASLEINQKGAQCEPVVFNGLDTRIHGLQPSEIDGFQVEICSDEEDVGDDAEEHEDGTDEFVSVSSLVDHQLDEKIEKICQNEDDVAEMGRRVEVLGQKMKKSQDMDPHVKCPPITLPQIENMKRVQKILDIFDVVIEAVGTEEYFGNTPHMQIKDGLMAEVASLRAGQLALIQDEHERCLHIVDEVRSAFESLGYLRCRGLFAQIAKLVLLEKAAYDEQKASLIRALEHYSQSEINDYQTRRGVRALAFARAAQRNKRFDHSLVFILKAKAAFNAAGNTQKLHMLEDLHRTVVMEATRKASKSLVVEDLPILSTSYSQHPLTCAGRSSANQPLVQHSQSTRSTASDHTECTAASEAPTDEIFLQETKDEEKVLLSPSSATDQIFALLNAGGERKTKDDDKRTLFSPSKATNQIFALIKAGGKVCLDQEHTEIENEIEQLKAGLRTNKSPWQVDHRTSADVKTPDTRASKNGFSPCKDVTSTPSSGTKSSMNISTLPSRHNPQDGLLPAPVIHGGRLNLPNPAASPTLLKRPATGGMVGAAMELASVKNGRG